MPKRGKLKQYARVKGSGENCPKCERPMERRERTKAPETRTYFYTEWDYCKDCGHIQHYEKFKSTMWQEDERQSSFLKSI